MVVPPAEMQVAIPDVIPTVPTEGVELDHVPPAGVAVSVVVAPAQNAPAPAIPVGEATTVTVLVAKQPGIA